MQVTTRSVLLWVLLGAIFSAPVVVGAFEVFPYAPVAVTFFVFASYALGPARNLLPQRVALVLLSVCFGVTLSDMVARPLLFYLFEVRPAERYIYPWPPLPQLHRYVTGINYEGVTYGDLAAVSGRRDWREERRVRFVTDEYGFRNEPGGLGVDPRPVDVIVLGDSFGVAAGTSQEETLSSLLARDYGLTVYNLSISRENPQQEYANLLLEGKRLKARQGACVLWLIFSGNDLDEPYFPELENPQPEWPGPLRRLISGFSAFRSRSPVHRLLSRRGPELVIERALVDGRRVLFFAPYAQLRGRTAEDVLRHPNFERLKATLGAMERLTSERGLGVSVALVPSKEEVYSWILDGAPPWSADGEPSGFSAVLRELCEQHGFRFLDLKPPLVEASRLDYEKTGSLLWWRDDTHWNGNGQRVAAAAVYSNHLCEIQTR
ncbi:MAG TPA: hypothetical protein VMS31_05920 [Pyrinomonadaceae bacterium]|nr:hypothetical protein [Pyrinomonadaceae bacterium]